MKIHFYIDSMGAGGAERVTSLLVNRWADQGHDVHLLTLASTDEDHYPLHEGVRRSSIGWLGPVRSSLHGACLNLRRVRLIRAHVRTEQPDVVISFITRMNLLVLLATGEVPVVVSERSNPATHRVPKMIDLGRRRLYRRAAAVVAQTRAVARWIEENCPGATVTVIPNPVADLPSMPERYPNLVVAAGRLERRKGFDLLIEAMALVHRQHREAALRIYGTGELEATLREKIDSLNLQDVVELAGEYDDVAAALGGAATFVLSSRYEGYPNVLVEAMKLGIPVTSFACAHGPEDIIRHGYNGMLVEPEDTVALAGSISQLLESPDLRVTLRAGASTSLDEDSLDRIGEQWDSCLRAVVMAH